MVKCTNFNKFYRKQHVLKKISLTVQKADRIGVVGPNGTGKTTLWKTSWNSDWDAIARI
ncbi:ATP-binding cassette domain-containing protein [Spiroplasma kunkelii]|uniref:ATP-binding cassette domain-containing protein n=1 Tax=Spiroplasma kunkelii TaxID=47834 RepID=UPI0038CD8432